jgi:transcriptional regulator with XRE-family HTH domain
MTPIMFRVREIRRAKALTQTELARLAGVRQATVSRIENGLVSSVNLEVLEKLADALEVDPGFLIVRVPRGAQKRT